MRRAGPPAGRHLRDTPARWGRGGWRLAVGAGVVAVVAVVSGLVVSAGDGGDDRAGPEVPGSEVPGPEVPGPEVLGVTTEREPTPEATTSTTTSTSPASTTSTSTTTTSTSAPSVVASAPPPTAAPAPPTTTTTTTTVVCRNSSDPACGPLSWTPAPVDESPAVRPEPGPGTVEAGRAQDFVVVVDDPDGATAVVDCVTWTTSDPTVPGISSCGPVTGGCPRFGPHDAPPPTPRQTRVRHEVTFSTVGDHTVTVSGSTPDRLDDGCPNPYTSSWSHTFSITVVPADDGPVDPPADDGVRLG